MTSLENRHPLAGLAGGLKLNYPELAILVDSICQKVSSYDFFRLLATQLIPYLRKQKVFSTPVNRWERQCREYRRKQETLKNLAIKEVRSAVEKLAERLESSPKFKTAEVMDIIKKAKGYLDGTTPACMPPYYECAAEELVSACRLLLQIKEYELLEEIAEPISVTKPQLMDGVWQSVEVSSFKKYHFYDTITKLAKERSKWRWNSFDHCFVCWTYLRLAERCWNLTEEDFDGESLKYQTVDEGQRSAELLGLHGYWTELLLIKNKRSGNTPFFTVERFSKYLEVVATQILMQSVKNVHGEASLGLTAVTLALDGEHLLLVVEGGKGKEVTRHLLHKFDGASDPRRFINQLIANPGNEVTPSDLGMKSNSCANLIKRAKLTGALKELFIKKGQRKDSIVLPEAKVVLKEKALAVRLNVQQQLEEMNLAVYHGY